MTDNTVMEGQVVAHSPKFETIRDYYNAGRWKEPAVRAAVTAPIALWRITAEEYEEITGKVYE